MAIQRDRGVIVPLGRLPEEYLEPRGFNAAAALAHISEQIYELHQEILRRKKNDELQLLDTVLTDNAFARHMQSNSDVEGD